MWKLNVTDRRTDGRGALQYLPSRAFGAAGDKKLSGRFWEINILSEKLTPTTDESALEKVRGISAAGANNKQMCLKLSLVIVVSDKYWFKLTKLFTCLYAYT